MLVVDFKEEEGGIEWGCKAAEGDNHFLFLFFCFFPYFLFHLFNLVKIHFSWSTNSQMNGIWTSTAYF